MIYFDTPLRHLGRPGRHNIDVYLSGVFSLFNLYRINPQIRVISIITED